MRPLSLVPAFCFILLSLQAASWPGAVDAEEVALNPNRPETYVVRPGDNLWDIAGRFLRNPWDWPRVWKANPGVANPNRIYPGDTLRLTVSGGRAQVRSVGGKRVVKLSPRVRVQALDAAVPTIPIGVIGPFLSQPYVAQNDDIERAAYVVGFPDDHIAAGLGDSLFARRLLDQDAGNYEIVRPGQPYKDPDTGEVLGYEAAAVATATMLRGGDPAILRITQSETEVQIGDRLVPAADESVLSNFYPQPAAPGTKARIISVLNGVTQIGQYNIVVLNRGARDGIKEGQVLLGFSGGSERQDQVLARTNSWNWRSVNPLDTEFWYGDSRVMGMLKDKPDPNVPLPPHADVRPPNATYVTPFEEAGTLMVFRVFDRVSFALVMRATRPMHIRDTVAAPRT
jgi:hypothetical protein